MKTHQIVDTAGRTQEIPYEASNSKRRFSIWSKKVHCPLLTIQGKWVNLLAIGVGNDREHKSEEIKCSVNTI